MTPDRRGFALVAALLSVVLIGALIVGAFLATTEDLRVAGAESSSLHSLNAAESAAQESITGWAAAQADSVAIGQRKSHTEMIGGLAVQATLVRLDSSVFWLVGDAGAGVQSPTGDFLVRRRVGLYLRRVADSAGRGSFLRFDERAWSELF